MKGVKLSLFILLVLNVWIGCSYLSEHRWGFAGLQCLIVAILMIAFAFLCSRERRR